ncbi:unnamed protein product [Chrysoparadoxa australica]
MGVSLTGLVSAVALLPSISAYNRPTVSSTACVEVLEEIQAITDLHGNDRSCMSCEPANALCGPGCQVLVHELQENCAGVTLPDGWFYDPGRTITGSWDDPEVAMRIKISIERCGCSAAWQAGKRTAITAIAAAALVTTLLV